MSKYSTIKDHPSIISGHAQSGGHFEIALNSGQKPQVSSNNLNRQELDALKKGFALITSYKSNEIPEKAINEASQLWETAGFTLGYQASDWMGD